MELVRLLTYDLPPIHVRKRTLRTWQHAAAEYSAVANRLLEEDPRTESPGTGTAYAALDAADAALAEAERLVDSEDPGVLVRRTNRLAGSSVVEFRKQMPEGTLVVEYLAVGDDLLAVRAKSDGLEVEHRAARVVDAGGHADQQRAGHGQQALEGKSGAARAADARSVDRPDERAAGDASATGGRGAAATPC